MPAVLLRNPVVRLLASVRFGVGVMIAILVYASLASALPQLRGAVEMTEMQIFRHWSFAVLVAIFTLSLLVATFTRISFRLVNLGVLTVHTGLLLLVAGAVSYFAGKIEGDMILLSPRVQLVSTSGGSSRVVGEILADRGQSWSSFMPAFGGQVSMEIDEVERDAEGSVARAVARVRFGEAEEQKLALAGGQSIDLADGRLKIQLRSPPPADCFHDSEAAALYLRRDGDAAPRCVEISGLPLYRERYLDEGYVLRDTADREVRSKRSRPAVSIGGLEVPTGWFEHWRMPIDLPAAELPFDVRITGYLPYIAGISMMATGGGETLNPAVNLRLAIGASSIEESLFALDAARSMMPGRIPLELKWVASEAEREALLRPLAGADELSVEIREPPVRRTFAVTRGQTIRLEGTKYELTIKDLRPDWPLITPGYEGSSSPMASVEVTNGEKTYTRTVIQRFPQLSQDIDEQGVRHREGPYDPNLVLHYRTSAMGWVTITAGPGLPIIAGIYGEDGSLRNERFEVGTPRVVEMLGTRLECTVVSLFEKAQRLEVPVIEPLERRRPNLGARSASAVRLRLTGRGEHAGESVTRWCVFSQYPHEDARAIKVRPPGQAVDWEIIYSRLERPLGVTIAPGRLSVKFFPGRQNVESWRSDFFVKDSPGDPARPGAVYTNQTCRVGEWTLFQSGAAGDHWSYTILGVGNRRGIAPMVVGCVLITLGCLFAFYVKPVLRRRMESLNPPDLSDSWGQPDAGRQRSDVVSLAEATT